MRERLVLDIRDDQVRERLVLDIRDDQVRERLVLDIRDDQVRERLLRSNDLTLQKAVDTIQAAEQTQQQFKLRNEGEESANILR